jgi:hypothetical protein
VRLAAPASLEGQPTLSPTKTVLDLRILSSIIYPLILINMSSKTCQEIFDSASDRLKVIPMAASLYSLANQNQSQMNVRNEEHE